MCNVVPPSAPFKGMGQLSEASQAGRSNPTPQQAAPVNPMSVAMAGKAASTASATPFQAKPMRIADSFIGTTDTAAQKPESGYKVVG